MRATRDTLGAWIILAATVVAAGGCREPGLVSLDTLAQPLIKYVNVEARFCTLPRAVAKQKIKYLFILDHSASNQPGFPNPLTPNDNTSTDPTGARRYGPLAQFIGNLVPDPNNLTYFALIDFNDQAAQPSGQAGFVQDPNAFLNNVARPDWIGSGSATNPTPRDQGFTNYQAALQLAYQLIRSDAQNESVNPDRPITAVSYQIVFASDGVPTIASSGGGNSVYTQTFATDIGPVISNIVSLKSDPALGPFISSISLNTAYYYRSVIAGAQTLLQQMALAGNGQYLEFGSGQSIVYQAFAPPVRNLRYILGDVWVENRNLVAWDDGTLRIDSDGDGLPDDIELALGSNPFVADTDGNGVSDLVEYRTKGTPCNGGHCAPASRDPYAICDGFSPVTGADGRITFASSARDGLNDCEKFILGADRSSFDSNGDFVPDLIALKNGLPLIAGTNGTLLNVFGDPLNNYLKLKAGFPLSISQSKLNGLQARQTQLLRDDAPSDDVSCYHMTVTPVAVATPGDTIRISVIQNSSVLENKPVLTVATQPWDGSATTIVFGQGDFR